MLIVKIPTDCQPAIFPGCQNCRNGCERKTLFFTAIIVSPIAQSTPPNIAAVHATPSTDKIKVNMSIDSSDAGVREYFLHTKSSEGTVLHRLSNVGILHGKVNLYSHHYCSGHSLY